MAEAAGPAPGGSHQDPDLIDDRALTTASGDRFRHEDFAEELTDTILMVRTPANIALYGAWGAGKTGLANLIKERILEKKRKDVKFVSFDAFKYAETPLRRHVIAQVAKQLGINDERYSADLYRSKQGSRFDFPPVDFLKLLGKFILVLISIFALAIGVVAFVAWRAKGSLGSNLSKFIGSGLALAFAPASLVAAFVTLTGKTLTIQRTTSPPTGDEEFEKLFGELVEKSKAQRLIIFVDELDRCSPREVVETLDTIRTFLEVKNCVFIVAADQQVIEQALRRKVRQTTPVDPANPYYSAGSAYLDKVFHYQISLPPLTPRRLSRFALELVHGKVGLWAEIDQEAVISVLIPTHVRSPRRVKVLLNNFVLAYRLVSRRITAGLLDGPAKDRATELAKLVCLRSEFPLFAADLVLEPRIPEFVLLLLGKLDEVAPSGVTEDAWERARGYAKGTLPLETNLVRSDEAVTASDGDDEAPEAEEPNAASRDEEETIQRAQHQQLIAYLSRTRHVPNPRRDLIYLESSGSAYGLDPGLAERLEDYAVDGRVDEVIQTFSGLNANDQEAALRMLAQRIREAPPGIEGQNAVSTLLRVLGTRADAALDENLADDLADAVSSQLASYQLRPEELNGAYLLGLKTQRAAGQSLLSAVLARDEVLADLDLELLILGNADQVLGEHRARMGAILADAMYTSESVAPISETLLALARQTAITLIKEAAAPFKEICKQGESAEEESEERRTLDSAMSHAGELIDQALDGQNSELAEALVDLVLRVDSQGSRNVVEERLERIGKVRSRETSLLVLSSCSHRAIARWPKWVIALDPDLVGVQVGAFEELVSKLWTEAVRSDAEAPAQEAVLAALESLRPFNSAIEGMDREELNEVVVGNVGQATADPTAIAAQDRILKLVDQFAHGRLLNAFELAKPILTVFITLARSALDPQPIVSPAVQHELLWGRWIVDFGDVETLREFHDAIRDSVWIPSPAKETLRLEAVAALRRAGEQEESPVPIEDLRSLVVNQTLAFSSGLATWIRTFARNPAELWQVVETFARQPVPEDVAAALRDFSEAASPADRLAIASFPIKEDAAEIPTDEFLSCIRFSECDHEAAVELLISRYEEASSAPKRAKVLRCWEALKPVQADLRRKLVDKVFLPFVLSNASGYEIALDHLSLALPTPYGTRGRISKAFLTEAAVNKDLRRKAEDKLRAAGLARRGGLLGRRTEPVDE